MQKRTERRERWGKELRVPYTLFQNTLSRILCFELIYTNLFNRSIVVFK